MELTLNARPVSAVLDDSRLVASVRAGDDRAFEQLYARYRERIYVFILSKVRDHGRAEDIAQEVFMSALRQMRSSQQDLAFKPWLYTIARNACIDEFRRGARGTEVPVESEADLDAGAAQRPMLAAVPTPAAAVESKQQLDDLRGAFEGLTESQHQLLVMREFEGLSYDEIGDRLSMTKPMVESGLFRARRKLSEEYDELASGRRCEQIQTAIDAGTLRTAKRIGIRERRRYSRHLSHCQPCRHVALMTGVDESLLKPRRLVDKVAALLPFPFVRRLLGHGGSSGASHAGVAGAAAQAAGAVTSTGASIGLGQAATFAAIAAVGAGGGLYATHAVGHHHAPAAIHRVTIAPAASVRAPETAHAVAHVATPAAHHARAVTAATAHRSQRHAVAPPTVSHATAHAAAQVATGPAVATPVSSTERNPVASAPAPTATGTTPTATATTAGATTPTTPSPTTPRSTPTTPTATTPTTTSTTAAPTTATTPATDPVATPVGTATTAVNSTLNTVGATVDNTVGTVATTVNNTVNTVAGTAGSTLGAVGSTLNTVVGGLPGSSAPTDTTPSAAPTTTTATNADPVTPVVNGVASTVNGLLGGS